MAAFARTSPCAGSLQRLCGAAIGIQNCYRRRFRYGDSYIKVVHNSPSDLRARSRQVYGGVKSSHKFAIRSGRTIELRVILREQYKMAELTTWELVDSRTGAFICHITFVNISGANVLRHMVVVRVLMKASPIIYYIHLHYNLII